MPNTQPDPLRDLNYIACILLLANILTPAGLLPSFIATMDTVEQYGYAVLFYSVLMGTRHYFVCVCCDFGRALARLIRGLWRK